MAANPKLKYSFVFDEAKQTYICSVHGAADDAWLPCSNCGGEGFFDAHERDPGQLR